MGKQIWFSNAHLFPLGVQYTTCFRLLCTNFFWQTLRLSEQILIFL